MSRKRTCFAFALGLALFPLLARASDLETALRDTMADIRKDTLALNALREEIDATRVPLAMELDALRVGVAEKRVKVEAMRLASQQSGEARAILEAEVAGLEDECRLIQTLFSEYARGMDARANVAESVWLKERAEATANLSSGENFAHLASAVEELTALSAEWRLRRVGGNRFVARALDASGVELDGTFVSFGPIAYFSASDASLSGMAVTRFGSALPSVYNGFEDSATRSIARLIDGEEAVVPLDVTAGDAIKIEEAKDSFVDHVKKGGFVIWPLLGVGVVAAVLVVWKGIALSGVKVRADEGVADVVAAVRLGDVAKAEELAARLPFPLSDLLSEAVAHHDAPRDHLEELMHERVLGALPKLESHLGTLAVLGGVAPLLGLLGTVTGMIHTFQLVTLFGSGDAKLLSGGISEALVTTEFGLAIAIPVLLTHSFLARRANGLIGELEQTAVGVVNDLKVRTSEG